MPLRKSERRFLLGVLCIPTPLPHGYFFLMHFVPSDIFEFQLRRRGIRAKKAGNPRANFPNRYIYTYGAERRAPSAPLSAGRNAVPRICR